MPHIHDYEAIIRLALPFEAQRAKEGGLH